MRIFKYRHFKKWAKEEEISDQILIKTVEEMNRGLIDADLGGGLYKKRVPRPGQGKRGGYRVLLAFKQGRHVFFLYGFAKNECENIDAEEHETYLSLANYLFQADAVTIDNLLKINEITEVSYENKN